MMRAASARQADAAQAEGATTGLIARHGALMRAIAAQSIAHGMATKRAMPVDLAHYPPALRPHGASFVTLKRQGRLRGCIGTVTAHRPLAVDIAESAFKAAFRDPRFKPVAAAELGAISISVTVLSAPEPMVVAGEAELIGALRPGVDGLIIDAGQKRGVFLPAVWDTLPDAGEFVAHLKAKAGLAADEWSPRFRCLRFTAEDTDMTPER